MGGAFFLIVHGVGMGAGGIIVPADQPGVEFRMNDERLHYSQPDRRLHARLNDDRTHFSQPDSRMHYRLNDGRLHFTSDGTDE